MRSLLPLALVALLVLVPPPPAGRADLLVPRSGKPVRGALMSETSEEVVFNPFWSRNPGMTWEVMRLRSSRVKRVEVEPHPEVEVFRRLAAAPPGDADALVEIGDYARAEKLKAHARMCYALALAIEPEHLAALKGIGGRGRWDAERKGNPQLDPELRAALEAYAAEDDPEARGALWPGLKRAGWDGRPEALERRRRSLEQPRGLQVDRPLSWTADELPGAVYTLYVPSGYDPARPWPLIVGLHGGGADGKRGDEVVGSGPSAMNFYQQGAAQHGILVACPTALMAGWGNPKNEQLVRAVIEEVKLLYHVDVDRIYLTGHSMGGFGTWALGPRLAEDLAAISPMAGGGGSGISDLVRTRTPIFIYHSDDDYVSVSSDRAAARRLRDTDLDFVYTELPGQGHGFPESIRLELFEFFGPRRRYVRGAKSAWPRSSFEVKVSDSEVTWLGDPLDALEERVETADDWVDQVRRGGGRAVRAVARLEATKPVDAVSALSKILKDERLGFDARAWAARALGAIGDAGGARALRRAVAAEATREQSRIAVEAARALVRLADADASASLLRGVETWCDYLEDKVMAAEGLRYSDWQRAVPVLAVLVEAAAVLGDASLAEDLERQIVERVFAPGHRVETSERVPQDPSVARTALARALAGAYAAWDVPAASWDALLEAVRADAKAHAAVTAARR